MLQPIDIQVAAILRSGLWEALTSSPIAHIYLHFPLLFLKHCFLFLLLLWASEHAGTLLTRCLVFPPLWPITT